jgi:hypothetical protein
MVRDFGHEIVSSGDLVAYFEAPLSDEQIQAHFEIGRRVRDWRYDGIQHPAMDYAGLCSRESDDRRGQAVVAMNEDCSIPHYAPTAEHSAAIRNGDFVLLMFGRRRIRRTARFMTSAGPDVSANRPHGNRKSSR